MTSFPTGLAPVAIALDQIQIDQGFIFSGIDLESGGRLTVTVKSPTATFPTSSLDPLPGLILVISLQQVELRL